MLAIQTREKEGKEQREVQAGAGTGPGKDTVACEPVNPAVDSVDRVKATTRAKTAAAITKVAA